MPTNDPRPSKAVRRDEARVMAQKLREQQKKRDRRNRIIAISGLVAALAVLAIVVVVILGNSKSNAPIGYSGTALAIADSNPPSTAQANGGIPVGSDGVAGTTSAAGAVTVDLYTDYMCSACGEFEKANVAAINQLRTTGDITVVYHPISILDRMSNGTEYSTRAANAAAIVADAAPDAFVAFNDALFANQPAENTAGLSDARIAELALGANVPQSVVDTFADRVPAKDWLKFAPYVAALTAQATTDITALGEKQVQTPTVALNGQLYDYTTYNWTIAGNFEKAVAAAKAAK